MPIVESTYKPPFFPLNNGHIQTILPSYLRKETVPSYVEREVFSTPDDDELLLDWWRVGSSRLVIVSHGLCGHSRRHYVVSLARAFNRAGWDCLAWNFRGTGGSPGKQLKFTTQNATEELDWVTRHALRKGGYQAVAYSGYSMGGNLSALYLAREVATLPPEVKGAVVFCATTDIVNSNRTFHSWIGRKYTKHFLVDMVAMIRRKAAEFPGKLDVREIEKFRSFEEFDRKFTAPYLGLRDEIEYYETASACRHFSKLRVPLLLVAPKNDPFLLGDCYPVEEAKRNPNLYLEMPDGGGHCGFITLGKKEWWPARRAVGFLKEIHFDDAECDSE